MKIQYTAWVCPECEGLADNGHKDWNYIPKNGWMHSHGGRWISAKQVSWSKAFDGGLVNKEPPSSQKVIDEQLVKTNPSDEQKELIVPQDAEQG